MRPSCLVRTLLVLIVFAQNVHAQFDGKLELIPTGCEQIGQCTLKSPLRFTDSKNIVWETKANLVTDGASIPGIFQPFVGSPFGPDFIRAAVIHDHYCDRHVRPWTQTHRVFYEGLIAGGVPLGKAKTMYFAVVLGGPKWIQLVPGIKCGDNCVKNFKSTSGVAGIYSRKANYSATDVGPSMQAVAKLLDINPDSLSLEDIEKLARQLRPGDFFFKNGDKIDASSLGITE